MIKVIPKYYADKLEREVAEFGKPVSVALYYKREGGVLKCFAYDFNFGFGSPEKDAAFLAKEKERLGADEVTVITLKPSKRKPVKVQLSLWAESMIVP